MKYIQYVDSHNCREFIQHMASQKTIIKFAKTTIKHCVVEGKGFARRVDAVKKNGDKLAVKVILYFEIKNGKIILCDELTKLLVGEEGDLNIVSTR